jgi:hypothetical protein
MTTPIGERMRRRQAALAAAEDELRAAVRQALAGWLSVVRAAALPGLTAAAGLPPHPAGIPGTGQAWLDQVAAHLLDPIGAVFDAGTTDAGGGVELLRVVQRRGEYVDGVANRLVGVPDEAWRQVATVVDAGLSRGAALPDISGADAWVGRADAIARTEATGAYNAGTLAAWQTADVDEEVKKVWVATHDDRTRDDHRVADGQRVPIDGVFTVGGVPMRHPATRPRHPGKRSTAAAP